MPIEYVKVSGSVENIVFSNSDTGFTVLDLNIGEELLSVVGQMLGVEVGEELSLTGYYDTHKTYGMQFKVQLYERSLPATQNAIIKYLSSGAAKGIGKTIAKKIVDKFGTDTFKIIEEEPHRLIEVSGISKEKSDKMAEQFKQVFGMRALMSFLSAHNINAMQSVMVYKKWGTVALDLIKQNPYILITGDFVIDFSLVDNMAKTMGIPTDSPLRISASLEYILSYNTKNGHTCLPKEKLIRTAVDLLNVPYDTVVDMLDELLDNKVLYRLNASKELIFLSTFYMAQKYICSRLQLMLKVYSDNTVDVTDAINAVEQDKGIKYEALQRKAIEQAVINDVFILTGGPGTGKTTTLNGIIEVLEQQGKKVAIAAPTGRAAKRIAEVTDREAKTIHRLLEVAMGFAKSGRLEFVHNEQDPLDMDVVIIDEISMIDTMLFDSLLRGMKPTAKLILVGDYHQLPSVGAGNILRDLIKSDTIPMVSLTHIFRQAAKSLIVTNAHKIVNGEMPELKRKDADFFFMQQHDAVRAAKTIVDLCEFRLKKAYGFDPFEQIQVLCPQRNGELGVIELNKKLQLKLNPPTQSATEFQSGFYTFRIGDKVMQIKNNYDIEWKRGTENGMGIFNGDIGIIKMIDKGSKTLAIDFDTRLAYYSFDMALELELAYAVTVHKSQGSEFEAVIVPILGGYDKLYFRNLLYTAVTRAKKILIIIGSAGRVEFMVQNRLRMHRFTGLRTMLQDNIFNDGNGLRSNDS